MQLRGLLILLLQYYLCKIYSCQESTDSTLNVICERNTTIDQNMPRYPQSISVKTINFDFCPPPEVSFALTLTEHNISVSAVRKLIVRVHGDRLITPSEFQGLNIEELSVSALRPQAFDMEVLEPWGNLNFRALKVLALSGFRLPPLPATSEFTKITLENGTSLGEFGGCRSLEELVLRKWAVPPTAGRWLADCQELRSLTIDYSTPEEVERILDEINNITHLAMINCQLDTLPNVLENFTNLKKLDLSNNQFYYIPTLNSSRVIGLKELILDSNKLNYCKSFNITSNFLQALVNLSVADNRSLDLCNKECRDHRDMYYGMPSLKQLNAAHTSTSNLCFGNSTLDAMEYFNFTKSDIRNLQFKDLPMTSESKLRIVDLRDSPIVGVSLQEEEYKTMPSGISVLGVNVTVDCECANAWLASAMRVKRLSIGARCLDHTSLADWPADQSQCERFWCSEQCICKRAWHDNVTVARCDGRLHALPRLEGVREIHAADNLITYIGATELPQSLAFLDLSSNHISRISAAEAAALFAGGTRIVRLAGNPLVCDCAALPLLQALRTHQSQVKDYHDLICANDQRLIRQVDLDALCAKPIVDLWLVGGLLMGVVALISLLTAMYFRFKRELKMFLLVHGCCIWCIHEDDVEGDRPYDAFVSFSHLDDEFVSEHLLPGLEAERRYRLCVHYRDWIVGEWISTQISQSVDRSKRVVIVLSKNFLASTWALLEFRLAQMRSLKEGRNIIIAVIIDDVLEDQNMNAEIRGYLAMTTYVKWEDPWFWKKLMLALPLRGRDQKGVTMETAV